MMATGEAADAIADAEGLRQESGTEALASLVDQTLLEHPDQVAQYGRPARRRRLPGGPGDEGQRRRANPSAVDRLVRARLDSPVA